MILYVYYIFEHSSSIPLVVFIFHSYKKSGKGQVVSGSRPLSEVEYLVNALLVYLWLEFAVF